jgi:hypothetical protein
MRTITVLLPLLISISGCAEEEVAEPSATDAVVPSMDLSGDSTQGVQDASDRNAVDTAVVDAHSPDTGGPPGDVPTRGGGDSSPPGGCAYPLVTLQTGKDTECTGGNTHQWPIGMAESDCHGWSAVDTSGSGHDNSASAIACNEDGSFSFTQYAGNLTCSGSGTVKTFYPEVCQQDIPPVLHTKATNLACCTDLAHPDCVVGAPSVSIPGGAVTLNGQACP